MAMSNKESLVVIIDVREGPNKTFKEKAVKIASEILKEKICAGKKDLITFLLLGTKQSNNLLNGRNLGYENIVEYPQPQIPTWNFFCEFLKFVNDEEPGTAGDWLDALVVALEIHKEKEADFKCSHRRILLFHNFDGTTDDFSDFDTISNALVERTGLIVVSDKIKYIDNAETGEPQAVFQTGGHKTQAQILNEKYALRLVSDCNAILCNFGEALHTILKLNNKRPWTWHGNLVIGSEITIAISGVIAIKDESNIKLKKCWGEVDEVASREKRTYVKGVEAEPLDLDVITGYMLGATPVAFDDDNMEDEETVHQPGLKFLGFPKLNSVPEEYYCGDSLYWIIHRKGMVGSAKKLDALVQALHNTGRAMLCWKIYSQKFNNPKLVLLLPNELRSDRPASLSMIELTYHAQHHYWDFPALNTEKTQCSKAQLDAIDDLIDSMDLTLDDTDVPRTSRDKDLLPFDKLPHIYEQNIMDVLERKIINANQDDEQFHKMLAEKNFVEAFWKVPEKIEENAKHAASKVRELFPLEKSTQAIKTKVNPANASIDGAAAEENSEQTTSSNEEEHLKIDRVGIETPGDDLEKLLKHRVLSLKDLTARDQQFHLFAKQVQDILWDLIFETPILDVEKIFDSVFVYRKCCFDFNSFDNYNDWIKKVKAAIVKRKELHDFWNEIIAGKNLGLCFIGQPTLEEVIKLQDFYKLDHPIEMGDTA